MSAQRAQQQYQHKSDAEQAVTRAAMLCQDPEFQLWLLRNQPGYSRDNWLPISAEAKEDHTKTILRNTLQCASRSEIATSPEVLKRFLALELEYRHSQEQPVA